MTDIRRRGSTAEVIEERRVLCDPAYFTPVEGLTRYHFGLQTAPAEVWDLREEEVRIEGHSGRAE